MIIASSDTKSTRTATNYGATTATSTPSSSYSMGNPSAEASSGPYLPPPYQYYQPQEKSLRSRPWLRFLKGFLIAVGFYFVISYMVSSFGSSGIIPNANIFGDETFQIPQTDGNVLECFPNSSPRLSSTPNQDTYPGDYTFRESFSYTIPTSSDLIYFLSRGNGGHGSLQFTTSDDVAQDSVIVDIVVEYNKFETIQKSNICLLSRNVNERGVGFFTPRGIFSRDSIRFTVVVKFPRSSNEPLSIKGLDTQMGIWSQFLSLGNLVEFNRTSLRSANTPIAVHDVFVGDADFRTSNAPITGSFTTTKKLVLKTSNGAIDVVITMKNVDPSKATIAELETNNGLIKAPINLISESNDPDLPALFTVKAKTSNSPLTLSFPEAPISPFSILNLVGSTTNSAIKTTLHPTFEGHIRLESSVFGPTLEQTYVEDPSGQDRVRVVSAERVGGRKLSANVQWGENSPPGSGKVSLKTSNSPNVLQL